MEKGITGNKAKRLTEMRELGFLVKAFVTICVAEVAQIVKKGVVGSDILQRIKTLSSMAGYAVRSAAVGEDGQLSWAGQLKSLLFVEEGSLSKAIIECAVAAKSDEVAAYGKTHATSLGGLSLIVQEMVDAEFAGVLFTRNPVNIGEDSMIVEVVRGVAESLVSGLKEPHRFYLDGRTGKIQKEEGDMSIGLNIDQIGQLYEAGKRLRECFGAEQDIEWAFEKGTGLLFLNQARDITAFCGNKLADQAIRACASETKRLETVCGVAFKADVLSDQNIAELLGNSPSAMGFGLFTYCFGHGNGAIKSARNKMGYAIGNELNEGFFSLIAGKPRCSIIHDACSYRIKGIPLGDYAKLVNFYLGEIAKDASLANYPEVGLYRQNPSLEFLTEIFGEQKASQYALAYENFFAGIQALEDSLHLGVESLLAGWGEKQNQLRKKKGGNSNIRRLTWLYHEGCELLRTETCPFFVKVARLGFFAFARLKNLLGELFGEEASEYLNVLTSGIPLEKNPNLQFSAHLYDLKKGLTTLDHVVADYGHLSESLLEVSVPRYADEPELLLQLSEQIQTDPRENSAKSHGDFEDALGKVLEKAVEKRTLLEREVRITRTYLGLREMVKFHYLKGYGFVREVAVEIESMLGWEKGMIWNLTPEEIFSLEVPMHHALARQRKTEREASKAVCVPAIISVHDLVKIGTEQKQAGDHVLRGIGVTREVTEGMAVVIKSLHDPDRSLIVPGSILVTVNTDPAWCPVLAIIGEKGGIVTEIGGMLAHTAIYAREAGLAAVLNVPNATSLIRTGMKIRVDGTNGTVEILA